MTLDRIDDLFHKARGLPPEQWEEFTLRECPDTADQALLMNMLRTQGAAFDWFCSAEQGLGSLWPAPDPAGPTPSAIGPYRVLEELGRGGMGAVYLAEKCVDGYRQQVAVKLMRRESPELVRRFLIERRVLSQLDHPHIARLLDGGTSANGRPYLVMEYVNGIPLTEWIAGNRSQRQRLDLFLEIAGAVEYAHRNLVVHRDLKPGNILVDAEGHPKLLDFGIAKVLDENAGSQTVGGPFTPLYASPEQLRGGDITTLTDVYGLGLLLFELLTGNRVAPSQDLLKCRQLDRDLRHIVEKALRRRPEERYRSVHDMVDDVQRYRRGEAVYARGNAWTYRASKFLRRRWHEVAAGSIALFSAVLLLQQTALLDTERDKSRQINALILNVVDDRDPRGRALPAGEMLDRIVARMQNLPLEPRVRAELSDLVGRVYFQLGDYAHAAPLLQHALDGHRAEFGDSSIDVADSSFLLGSAYLETGNKAAAQPLLERAAHWRAVHFGDSHPETRRARQALSQLQAQAP